MNSYTKICEYCGKEFTPQPRYRKYCCQECALTAQKEKQRIRNAKRVYKKKEDRRLVCQYCGTEFFTNAQGEKKYCSIECANAVKKEYDRRRYLKMKELGKQVATSAKAKGNLHKCWECINAVPNPRMKTGCSWSMDYIPVEGWNAVYNPKLQNENIIESYTVLDCPNFIRG